MAIEDDAAAYECIIRKADQGDGWYAEYPDICGVGARGDTRAEAAEAGENVLKTWLAKAKELGIAIPKPGEARGATGEFKVRVPRQLHQDLSEYAAGVSLSLNEAVTRLLTSAVSRAVLGTAGPASGQFQCAHLPMAPPHRAAASGQDFSGTWVQRTPRILHLHLQRLSDQDAASFNTYVVYLLATELARIEALYSVHGSEKERSAA